MKKYLETCLLGAFVLVILLGAWLIYWRSTTNGELIAANRETIIETNSKIDALVVVLSERTASFNEWVKELERVNRERGSNIVIPPRELK